MTKKILFFHLEVGPRGGLGFRESKEGNKGAPPPLFSSFFHLCVLELRVGSLVFLQVFEGRFVRAWRREQRRAWRREQGVPSSLEERTKAAIYYCKYLKS
jgi:hypothetical protein